MQKFLNENLRDEKKPLKLWYCENCDAAHLDTGDFTLNFDREQFGDFADAVAKVYCQGWWRPNGENQSQNIDETNFDDILTSEVIN